MPRINEDWNKTRVIGWSAWARERTEEIYNAPAKLPEGVQPEDARAMLIAITNRRKKPDPADGPKRVILNAEDMAAVTQLRPAQWRKYESGETAMIREPAERGDRTSQEARATVIGIVSQYLPEALEYWQVGPQSVPLWGLLGGDLSTDFWKDVLSYRNRGTYARPSETIEDICEINVANFNTVKEVTRRLEHIKPAAPDWKKVSRSHVVSVKDTGVPLRDEFGRMSYEQGVPFDPAGRSHSVNVVALAKMIQNFSPTSCRMALVACSAESKRSRAPINTLSVMDVMLLATAARIHADPVGNNWGDDGAEGNLEDRVFGMLRSKRGRFLRWADTFCLKVAVEDWLNDLNAAYLERNDYDRDPDVHGMTRARRASVPAWWMDGNRTDSDDDGFALSHEDHEALDDAAGLEHVGKKHRGVFPGTPPRNMSGWREQRDRELSDKFQNGRLPVAEICNLRRPMLTRRQSWIDEHYKITARHRANALNEWGELLVRHQKGDPTDSIRAMPTALQEFVTLHRYSVALFGKHWVLKNLTMPAELSKRVLEGWMKSPIDPTKLSKYRGLCRVVCDAGWIERNLIMTCIHGVRALKVWNKALLNPMPKAGSAACSNFFTELDELRQDIVTLFGRRWVHAHLKVPDILRKQILSGWADLPAEHAHLAAYRAPFFGPLGDAWVIENLQVTDAHRAKAVEQWSEALRAAPPRVGFHDHFCFLSKFEAMRRDAGRLFGLEWVLENLTLPNSECERTVKAWNDAPLDRAKLTEYREPCFVVFGRDWVIENLQMTRAHTERAIIEWNEAPLNAEHRAELWDRYVSLFTEAWCEEHLTFTD